MSKKLIIFFVAVFFSANLFAQIPGYMGKRFTIGYSNLVCPNLLSTATKASKGVVLYHSFNINYIITKQREICFSLKYYNRKFSNGQYSNSNYSGVSQYEKLSSLEYSLGFKRFNRAKFAPIGAYSKWEGLFISGWVNYKPYSIVYNDYLNASTTTSYSGGTVKLQSLGIAYSRGRQRVFKDKLVVDFGIRASLLYMYGSDAHTSYEDELASYADTNLTPIFNAYIGIGFLAF